MERNIKRPDTRTPKLISCHAEENLIKKLKNKKLKNYTLYTFRAKISKETGEIYYKSAKPCLHCHDLLMQHGVKKLYTFGDDGFEVLILKDFKAELSSAMRWRLKDGLI